MFPVLDPKEMRKKLKFLMEKKKMPLTLMAEEIGIVFPTLHAFLHDYRRQRYMVLVKINKFLKKIDDKQDVLEHS